MRRIKICSLSALAGAAVLAAGLPAAADAATMATCSDQTPALRWQVDRNTNGRDNRRRALSLQNASFSSASAIKPVRVTIVRGGTTKTLQWSSLNDEFRYRARKGERVGAMALYSEDSSGYDRSTVQSLGFLPVDLSPVVGVLSPPVQAVFGLLPPALQVAAPGISQPGAYGSQLCARALPVVVQEASAASKARTYRR